LLYHSNSYNKRKCIVIFIPKGELLYLKIFFVTKLCVWHGLILEGELDIENFMVYNKTETKNKKNTKKNPPPVFWGGNIFFC